MCTLCSSGVGGHFQLPILGWLGPKRHRKALQAITAGNEHGDLLSRTIMRQACLPVLWQHTVVVNGQDFVVYIETLLPAWGLALHLRDEEATVVRADHQAEPRFLRCGRCRSFKAQAEPVESFGVVEVLSGF
jgi:hypothetical protein